MTLFDRLRAVPFWKLMLFVLGWGILGPLLVVVGGIIVTAASGLPDDQAKYLAELWGFVVVAWCVYSAAKKLGY